MKFPRIFILTGAGLSAESGLGTFRDAHGIWANFNPEELASPAGYARNPARVLDFYNQRRSAMRAAKPNPAHQALAKLQAEWTRRSGEVFLCTQNIDNLLEQAGAAEVVHMHGELMKSRCSDCGALDRADGDLLVDMGCPACGRVGGLRPHVVWFGEEPLEMPAIYEALERADLFVAIGTSGAVYPAAAFVGFARERGLERLEINLAPSDNADIFTETRYGPASDAVPAWVDELCG
jgi:NAD-dependent deacetylase